MALVTYDVSTHTTDATITNTMNFVDLDVTDITLTLPSASAGYVVFVTVMSHPDVALTNGVVRVVPNTSDDFELGMDEVQVWELGATVKFVAIDAVSWMVVDVL